jgi:hypothetical protein
MQNNQTELLSVKICIGCSNPISQIRLDILPDTETCTTCSKEQKHVGFMDWYHKTAPELVFVPANDKENLRRANRVNNRAR